MIDLRLGDCLELMREIPDASIDAVITDPPYGIAYNPTGGNGIARRGNLQRVIGDDKPFDPSPFLKYQTVVLWGAHYYYHLLPKDGSWLIWYKRRDVPSIDFADCEMAWCNKKRLTRVFDHRWHGMIRDSERGELRVHPTQKPIAVMEWIIKETTREGDTILDPFMGSGTTGVACVKLNRNFVGFEINPDYFKIAERRIADAQKQPALVLT